MRFYAQFGANVLTYVPYLCEDPQVSCMKNLTYMYVFSYR